MTPGFKPFTDFLTLLFIVCGCNICIWRKLQQERITSHQQIRDSKDQRVTKTLGFVSIAALLSWLPFIVVTYSQFTALINSPTVFYTAAILNYSNSFLNPVMYVLRIPEFRQALGLCRFRRKAAMDNIKPLDERRYNRAVPLTPLTPVTLRSLTSRVLAGEQTAGTYGSKNSVELPLIKLERGSTVAESIIRLPF